MAGASNFAEQIRSKGSWKAALELLVPELQKRQPVDLRLVGPVLSACARQAAPWPIALALLEASKPGPIAYNSVANACERSGHWQQALAVLARMGSIRLELDSFSFCTQMCSLAAGQLWSEALQLERRLMEHGVEPNTILCSAAINACAKAGQWRCGLQLLGTMVVQEIPRSTVTFSSAISACAPDGAWTVALSLLGDMRKDQVLADTIVFSAAMSVCEKAGQWTAALDLFSQMQTLAVQLDTVSVSAVISACEKAAEWEAAVHLLSQADDLAATVTFSAAISACAKAAEWRVACALLQQLRMAALQLDAFPFSAAIAACAKVGQWQVSLRILQQMASHQVLADAATGSAMISACSNGGEWRWALHLLGACPPDVFAHSAALSACEAAGKWQHALQLLSLMVQQTLPVDGISVGAVVGAVQRALGEPAAVEQLKAICKGWLDASGDAKLMEELSGLEVILQVEGLVLLNKASGVLTEDLLATLQQRLEPCHATCISRLDAGTSGLLPVALEGPSSRWFKAQFAGRLAKKQYLCLCHGSGVVGSEQLIASPLRVDDGAPGAPGAPGFAARALVDEEHGREAVTVYKVLKQYRPGPGTQVYSLVEAKPKTGRMHQIRAHMASLGCPLVGDRQYGLQRVAWCQRLFLHCLRLELLDWSSEEFISLEAALPVELAAVLQMLERSEEL